MKRIIVTTTINEPTKAIKKFCGIDDWDCFIVVGDKKTPHELYRELEKKYPHVLYYSPEDQEKDFPELSGSIGWNCIQRRNLGFVKAYNLGAEIVATVDDDNIPYENWGKNLFVGKEIECDYFGTDLAVFDPLSATNNNFVWHRGYPLELVSKRRDVYYMGKIKKKVLVQADLWDGDPDVDAIARLTKKPCVKFQTNAPFCSNKISPFNSQNTFLSREVLPFYGVLPHVGRMDDIWGSYVLQKFFPGCVIYCPATVYQERNGQDLITNLEKEIMGYRNTLQFVNDLDNFENYLPEDTKSFWEIYRGCFDEK